MNQQPLKGPYLSDALKALIVVAAVTFLYGFLVGFIVARLWF